MLKYSYRVYSFHKHLPNAFCAHGPRGAEVNEIDIIHVLMGKFDSKVSVRMNKKLQKAKCSEGDK